MTLAPIFLRASGLGGSDDRRDRRCGQMVQRELIQTREVDIDPTDAHVYSGKARFCCETLQFLFGGGLPRSAKPDGGFVADKSSERFTDGAVVKPDAIPDAERETAAMTEHAAHLPQRERLIGKELQSLLAENHVKAWHPAMEDRARCARAIRSVRQPVPGAIARR